MSRLISPVHGWTGNKAAKMFGTQLFKFRFRGKISQIMNLYECFRLNSEENKDLELIENINVTNMKLGGFPSFDDYYKDFYTVHIPLKKFYIYVL